MLLYNSKTIQSQSCFPTLFNKLSSKIGNSDRLPILNEIGLNYTFKDYLSRIKNPDIRTLFTKLRIDMNDLNTCKFRLRKCESPKCDECPSEDENVKHVLFKCSKYNLIRESFYDNICIKIPYFNKLSDSEKLKIVLDMRYTHLDGCMCKYVYDVYKYRETFRV